MDGWVIELRQKYSKEVFSNYVFSQVFQARCGDLQQSGPLIFAINLFVGLIVFNLFSETANQTPDLVVRNSNLVTKVIFPLEILPAVTVVAAFFHAVTSLAVLFAFQIANGFLSVDSSNIANYGIQPTLLWLPLVWFPLLSGCLAMGWMLSALGVYLRDLSQVVGVTINLLMFLSAVFYPLSALPERWQPLLMLNPLVIIIDQTRQVCVDGLIPSLSYLAIGILLGLVLCEITYRAFQKARKGFADVL